MQVCDTVSELAALVSNTPGWPELLPFIFQCVQSNESRMVESALLIFAQLARYIMDTLKQYLGTLHEVLGACLTHSSTDIRIAAMRATTSFIQVHSWSIHCTLTWSCSPAQLQVAATSVLTKGVELHTLRFQQGLGQVGVLIPWLEP